MARLTITVLLFVASFASSVAELGENTCPVAGSWETISDGGILMQKTLPTKEVATEFAEDTFKPEDGKMYVNPSPSTRLEQSSIAIDVTHTRQDQALPFTERKVAVLTSGTLLRYFLDSTVQHLIKPMVQQGHKVDYYLALNTENFVSFQSDGNSFVGDPSLEGLEGDALRSHINQSIGQVGGHLRSLHLVDGVILTDYDLEFIRFAPNSSNWWILVDETGREAARTNFIKLVKIQRRLWRDAMQAELSLGSYTDVIIIKDDAYWLQDFDLSKFSSHVTGNYMYTLKCEAGSTWASHDSEMVIEFVLILGRGVAEPFGRVYDNLWAHLNEFNVEEYYRTLISENHIAFQSVSPTMIPFQRAGRQANGTGSITVCMHYKCASSSVESVLSTDLALPPCPGVGVVQD